MPPALEVVFTKPNDAYLKDPTVFDTALGLVAANEGCLGVYHGIKIEQPDIVMLLIVWDTIEDHHTAVKTENFPKITEGNADTPVDMFHVYLDCDLADVLNANVVSYGNIRKLKPGVDADEFLSLFKILSHRPKPEGCHLGGYAKAVERDQFLLLFGWDDIKLSNASRENQDVKTAMKKVHDSFEEADRGHVQLITYKKYQP